MKINPNDVLVTSAVGKRYLRRKYGDLEVDLDANDFYLYWGDFLSLQQASLTALKNALSAQYGLLDNKDVIHEHYTGVKTDKKTIIANDTNTGSNKTASFEGTLQDAGSSSVTTTGSNIIQEQQSMNDTFNGETTGDYGVIEKYEMREHGNIGLTSNQALLEKEISFRKERYIRYYDMFVSYIGGYYPNEY